LSEKDLQLLNEIKSIVQNGNKAEVENGRDGIKVIEVRRKVAYSERKPKNQNSLAISRN
jgi:hypothetical protein